MVKVKFPYRSTEMGGVDITFIFTEDGSRVEPISITRSGTGRHDYDVYELSPGTYYVAWFRRSNGGNKPIRVLLKRLIIYDEGLFRVDAIEKNELPQPVLVKVRAIYNKLIG